MCVLSWRRNGNGGNQMKAKLITAIVGVCIGAASWAPLMIVEAYDRYAMPVGLGLFAFAGSLVGGVIALVGVIGLMIQAARASKSAILIDTSFSADGARAFDPGDDGELSYRISRWVPSE
jgi:hypothetical protein